MKALILLFVLFVTQAFTLQSNASEKEKWQQWLHEYDQYNQSEEGWLSLVGLYWLEQGKNTLGSAKENQHRLPNDLPENFGSILVEKDHLIFTRSSNLIKIDDEDFASKNIQLNKTTVSIGTYSFTVIKREGNFAVRLKNSASPYLANFKGAKFYPYSDKFAIPAKLIKPKSPRTIKIATFYGTVRENDSAGILEFEYQGKTIQLEAVSYGEDYPMSLMFADETSDETTYGAGRYLDVEWPKNGTDTIINFNYSKNPPCAITEFATCPLPPRQNRLNRAIEAGEMYIKPR